ncbi:MAG: DUF3107 domain-containing protein [Intrasporangium sp.]|uniref:DUF3107 domain-containing protein n=1 Tax=Intrasporangium sp. TaxID=1925024 RepID=UPI00264A0A72|nr:DUF3107 domain-containing protein [Intrasporangium sp.]MDN5795108.1 DUF3107 domain-containing protein [Intrasporangium sp.]
MEVRIGVQHCAREITFESTMTSDELAEAVRASRSAEVLELTDDKGGRVLVPSAAVGYVTTGAEKKGGVGFGAQ